MVGIYQGITRSPSLGAPASLRSDLEADWRIIPRASRAQPDRGRVSTATAGNHRAILRSTPQCHECSMRNPPRIFEQTTRQVAKMSLGSTGPSPFADSLLRALLGLMSTKRSIFISYHHDYDEQYYDYLSRTFSETYGIIRDNSLDRAVDSDDPDYVMQRIREKYIGGTSCTLVLCGQDTSWRKYVDWEIKATLDKEHGLIGVNLPTSRRNQLGHTLVPGRLHDNIESGYSLWVTWANLIVSPAALKSYIEGAIARPKSLINNARPMRRRDGW